MFKKVCVLKFENKIKSFLLQIVAGSAMPLYESHEICGIKERIQIELR